MTRKEEVRPPKAPAPLDNPIEDALSGGNVRGEVPGCPTGLSGLHPFPEPPPREAAPESKDDRAP